MNITWFWRRRSDMRLIVCLVQERGFDGLYARLLNAIVAVKRFIGVALFAPFVVAECELSLGSCKRHKGGLHSNKIRFLCFHAVVFMPFFFPFFSFLFFPCCSFHALIYRDTVIISLDNLNLLHFRRVCNLIVSWISEAFFTKCIY